MPPLPSFGAVIDADKTRAIAASAAAVAQGNDRRESAPAPVGCVWVEADDAATVASHVIDAVQTLRRDTAYDVNDDLQVLSPMHKGAAGVLALNAALQEVCTRHWPRRTCKFCAMKIFSAARRY